MTTVHATTLAVEDLDDESRFKHLLTLHFEEIGAFLTAYYQKHRTPLIYAHIITVPAIMALMLVDFLVRDVALTDLVMAWGLGFLSFLLLLPIHEGIHGLAYKLYGAKDVRYGIVWRQGVAYAVAHRFVIDGRRFMWVALAPFLIINAMLLIAAAILPEHRLLLLSVLAWHTIGTAGDFALLNYFWLHRDRQIYTWDDADTKASHFCEARATHS